MRSLSGVVLALALAACGTVTVAVEHRPIPRGLDGKTFYATEVSSFGWVGSLLGLGGTAVLRCYETEGSRTPCTRLNFVVSDRLTAEDCKESLNCTDAGRCTLRDNACVAATAAECRASSGCTGNGHCTAVAGRCAAGSTEDCAGSQRCLRFGQCSFNGQYCIASTDADCTVSVVCREGGQCSAVEGKCLAVKDADCAQATACKAGGRCVARDGACVAAGKAAGGKGP